jgi:hypothetical protein
MKYLCDLPPSLANEWKESYSTVSNIPLGVQPENSPLILLKCILHRSAFNSNEHQKAREAIAAHIPVSCCMFTVVNSKLIIYLAQIIWQRV